MFGNKSTGIYITRNKIWAADPAKPENQVSDFAWDGVDMTAIFGQIKQKFNISSFKIILGNDLSYVMVLNINSKVIERKHILELISSFIPEDLTDHNFDWKIVSTNPENSSHLIQVFATPNQILSNISRAASVNKIKIEFIDPVSTTLAHATASLDGFHLILWKRQESLAVACYKGIVYYCEDLLQNTGGKLENLLRLIKDKYGLSVNHAVLDWTIGDKPDLPTDWKIEEKIIDPLLIISQKKEEKGQDKDVLTIKPVAVI